MSFSGFDFGKALRHLRSTGAIRITWDGVRLTVLPSYAQNSIHPEIPHRALRNGAQGSPDARSAPLDVWVGFYQAGPDVILLQKEYATMSVRNYLEMFSQVVGRHPDFYSMYELVAEHGILFGPGKHEVPEIEIDLLLAAEVMWPGFRVQECFFNAQRLSAHSLGGLRYFEGFAMRIIPVHHAWLVTPSGLVLDPTWRLRDGESPPCRPEGLPERWQDRVVLGSVPEDIEYVGVEFPYPKHDFIKRMADYEVAWSMLDCPRDREILRRDRWIGTSS